MKLTLQRITEGQEEVIVRYFERNEEVESLIRRIEQKNDKLGKTGLTLSLSESLYENDGFFRCSKSMVINIYHIEYLKSIAG